MSTFRRKIIASCGQVIAALALFFIIGGHWGVLQSVAWATMLWTYTSQDGSVLAGAKKTFDGHHPCSMCRSIKAAKKQETKTPQTIAATKKIELFSVVASSLLPLPEGDQFQYPRCLRLAADARSHPPEAPVPIA